MIQWLEEKDKKAYSMIRNRLVSGLDSPTLAEINEVLGSTSPRSAVLALERLEKAGLIRRMPGNKIRLTSESVSDNKSISTVDIPLVGTIAAGIPILAQENFEAMIPVSTAFARPGSKYFLLRVKGNSMNLAQVRGVNIDDKSIVLVRQQPSADEGDIVVALLNDVATVKIFKRARSAVILQPKSTELVHKPIVITEDCIIQGVVVAVLPGDLYL